MRPLFTSILFAALLLHQPACADETGTPAFNPAALKLKTGPTNDVLVLGTPHLSHLPKSFDPAQLSLLNERLASWNPQAIAIEELSGPQCAFMRSDPQRYSDAINAFCSDPSAAQAATGLTSVAAAGKAGQMLANWPASPSAAGRRVLASLFLAAGEPGSALVQWLRLPTTERHAGDGLNEALVIMLGGLRERRDETSLIAAPLAAKLGQERLYAVDDQTTGSGIGDEKAYAEAMTKAWNNAAKAQRDRATAALQSHMDTPAGVLAMYRAQNETSMAAMIFNSDFGAALDDPSPQRFGRNYVAYWEVRNLRMASNIRAVMGPHPGMRTLVIVGTSHKAYLDAYLDQMHDVRIVRTDDLLRP